MRQANWLGNLCKGLSEAWLRLKFNDRHHEDGRKGMYLKCIQNVDARELGGIVLWHMKENKGAGDDTPIPGLCEWVNGATPYMVVVRGDI